MIFAISNDTMQQWPTGIAMVVMIGSYLPKYQWKCPMLMQKASHWSTTGCWKHFLLVFKCDCFGGCMEWRHENVMSSVGMGEGWGFWAETLAVWWAQPIFSRPLSYLKITWESALWSHCLLSYILLLFYACSDWVIWRFASPRHRFC